MCVEIFDDDDDDVVLHLVVLLSLSGVACSSSRSPQVCTHVSFFFIIYLYNAQKLLNI